MSSSRPVAACLRWAVTIRVTIKAKIPVADSFGFTGDLRSGTEGRGVWFLVDSKFEKIPKALEDETIKKIRQRKGIRLDAEIA